jgi:hypothetical protein
LYVWEKETKRWPDRSERRVSAIAGVRNSIAIYGKGNSEREMGDEEEDRGTS